MYILDIEKFMIKNLFFKMINRNFAKNFLCDFSFKAKTLFLCHIILGLLLVLAFILPSFNV